MCTAVSIGQENHYFGRNLDWDFSFGEKVIVTPRNFNFPLKKENPINKHYAIMGIGIVKNNYPLYFDAVNEHGLCIAGLNFPGNAEYFPLCDNKINITPYEFIPFILGGCKNVSDAVEVIKNINFLNIPFDRELPLTPMHWIVADKNESITVESLKDGVKIYKNPVGVLTNNPTFDIQLHNLNNYINISPYDPENTFAKALKLKIYSRGMGAIGLPGDFSSQSRFVRASFVKSNIISGISKKEQINSFFHILSSVEMQKGCVVTKEEAYEYSVYSDCYDSKNKKLYLKTYGDTNILEFDLLNQNLDTDNLLVM